MWTYLDLTNRAEYEARLDLIARLAAPPRLASHPAPARWLGAFGRRLARVAAIRPPPALRSGRPSA